MVDSRLLLSVLLLGISGCIVPSHDQEGLACDESHVCSGGRICSAGICLDPDHVDNPPPDTCTPSCVDLLCGDVDSCGVTTCATGSSCTAGTSIDRMDDTSASWVVVQDSTSTMTVQNVSTPHIATNSMEVIFQIGNTVDSFAFLQRIFDAPIDMTGDSGLLLWVYSDNTGYPIRVELFDSDGVRFELILTDSWQGWHAVSLPFASMTRSAYQDPGVTAPQTTPSLGAVRGLTFTPAYQSGAQGTVWLDLLSRVRP